VKRLGREDEFLPFCSWVLIFASVILIGASGFNLGDYSRYFTRFVSESYGLLIALLLFNESMKGLAGEFEYDGKKHGAEDEVTRAWTLVNGMWGIILAATLLTLALVLSQARHTSLLTYHLREFLSDFGAPLSAVAVTGLSYALSGTPGQIPVRTDNMFVYESKVRDNWVVTTAMDSIDVSLMGFAIVPALILALLAYVNQLVVAKLTQQEDFGVKKPVSFSYDLMLVGVFFAVQSVTGLVPVTPVLPQSPLHTKSLMNLRPSNTTFEGMRKRLVGNVQTVSKRTGKAFRRATGLKKKRSAKSNRKRNDKKGMSHMQDESDDDSDHTGDVAYKGEEAFVIEQRVSSMVHSLLIGACLFLAPVLGLVPRAVLWGYFVYTAVEALPGNQCWHRITLLFIDPKQRRAHHVGERMPVFVDVVPYRHIRRFTFVQVFFIAASYGFTWVEQGNIVFPIWIALTLPVRHLMLRRFLKHKYLKELDRHEDVEEIIEKEGPEPPELRDDPHHYFTGERLGGHGAFGQVVRTVGERREGRRVMRELDSDENQEEIPACTHYQDHLRASGGDISESDVEHSGPESDDPRATRTGTTTDIEEEAGGTDADTSRGTEHDTFSKRMRKLHSRAHDDDDDEETMTKTEQNELAAQLRSLQQEQHGRQDYAFEGHYGEHETGEGAVSHAEAAGFEARDIEEPAEVGTQDPSATGASMVDVHVDDEGAEDMLGNHGIESEQVAGDDEGRDGSEGGEEEGARDNLDAVERGKGSRKSDR
jgi:hypothetical protein